jgi:hypothetical protein
LAYDLQTKACENVGTELVQGIHLVSQGRQHSSSGRRGIRTRAEIIRWRETDTSPHISHLEYPAHHRGGKAFSKKERCSPHLLSGKALDKCRLAHIFATWVNKLSIQTKWRIDVPISLFILLLLMLLFVLQISEHSSEAEMFVVPDYRNSG